MDAKIRCQSCGMPLGEGFYGTDHAGASNPEYCKFCFQNGDFVYPNQTLQEMITASVENMTKEIGMPREQAEKLAHQYIPQLKRWR